MNANALFLRLTLCVCFAVSTTLTAQDTAITYQGRLTSGPDAANGSYDLSFYVFDAPTSGNQVGPSITNEATGVVNGLFVVNLDFGSNVFTGPPRWLEIGVRTNGTDAYTILVPRQRMAPSPYALYAQTASAAATSAVANAVAPGSVGSSALQDKSIDGSKLADNSISGVHLSPILINNTFWSLAGNTGVPAGSSFLGTTDNNALEFKVNGQRAFRIEPTTNTPNVIGGFNGNSVSAHIVGVTIGGGGTRGGTNSVEGYQNPSDQLDHATPHFATIGGGNGNYISTGGHGTIAGGAGNSIVGQSVSFGGGDGNTIGGGSGNGLNGSKAGTIAGGRGNRLTGNFGSRDCTISGGRNNWIEGDSDPIESATIAGGEDNTIHNTSGGAAIGGGFMNTIEFQSGGSVIAGGSANTVFGYTHYGTIGGGLGNTVNAFAEPHEDSGFSVIAGGEANYTHRRHAAIGGGSSNSVYGPYGTIAGGAENSILEGERDSIGGGGNNWMYRAFGCTISGGRSNSLGGLFGAFDSSIGGGLNNWIEADSDPVEAVTIAGGMDNTVHKNSGGSTIGGGWDNTIEPESWNSTISGGSHNYMACGRRARLLEVALEMRLPPFSVTTA